MYRLFTYCLLCFIATSGCLEAPGFKECQGGSDLCDTTGGLSSAGEMVSGAMAGEEAAGIAAGEAIAGEEAAGMTAGETMAGEEAAGMTAGEVMAGEEAAGMTAGEAMAGEEVAGMTAGEAMAGEEAAGMTAGEVMAGEEAAGMAAGDTMGGDIVETQEFTVNDVTFRMRLITGVDEVSSFWIGETEVTQALYQAVMDTNPSYFIGDVERPVDNVSWIDAIRFCNQISETLGLSAVYQEGDNGVEMIEGANGVRLPFEAEWVLAAQGSMSFTYAGSNTLEDVAWCGANQNGTTEAVGQLNPNHNGLFDLSGNVKEWCNDDSSSPGSYRPDARRRSIRGGSILNFPQNCEVGHRDENISTYDEKNLGFRFIKPR